jgi:hypothetical protein
MSGMKKLSEAAIRRGNALARQGAAEPMETVTTSVRFGGDLRCWLEAQAAARGGVSVQSVITEILTGVMIETMEQDQGEKNG